VLTLASKTTLEGFVESSFFIVFIVIATITIVFIIVSCLVCSVVVNNNIGKHKTPLHYAMTEEIEVIRMLHKAGADINAVDRYGKVLSLSLALSSSTHNKLPDSTARCLSEG